MEGPGSEERSSLRDGPRTAGLVHPSERERSEVANCRVAPDGRPRRPVLW